MNNDEIRRQLDLYHVFIENDNDINELMDKARSDERDKIRKALTTKGGAMRYIIKANWSKFWEMMK
jgi:hypothetical protein